jgi:DNA repair exonuclease SbcCD ATPase subunit
MANQENEMECYSNNSEETEQYDIDKENKKIRDEMLQDLGIAKEDENENLIDVYKFQAKFYGKDNNYLEKKKDNIDPISRINKLKEDFENNSKELKNYISTYGDNLISKETENFDEVLKELDLYSKKLNSIIQSDAYKKNKNNIDIKNSVKENMEKYTQNTKELFELINNQRNDLLNSKNQDLNDNYELFISNKNNEEYDINKYNKDIKELENQITNLEQLIGIKEKENLDENTLSEIINNLIEIVKEKSKKTNKEKEDIFNKITKNLEEVQKYKDRNTEYFIKLKDLYSLVELNESYETILEYIEQRLTAIKEINEKSNKFSEYIKNISENIKINENKMKELETKYNDTLNEFSSLEKILKELDIIEKKITDLLLK